ncbi:MAG: carboxypeptidase-like regulatory domain-containing protein [Thermoleophilaceae bacterium]
MTVIYLAARARFAALALALALAFACLPAEEAAAYDAYPCGPEGRASWTSEPVQLCPLTSPLPPNDWVPVYRQPVPNPRGESPPPPDGWLHGIENQYFVCQHAFPFASYHHPRGWRNHWWALTLSDDDVWGWVPEVFFKGGADDEPDSGLRWCSPPPSPPPPAGSPQPPPAASLDLCDPSPPAAGLRMSVSMRRPRSARARRVVVVRYGKRLRVRGRLTGPGGTPLAGASICAASQLSRRAPLQAQGTLVTDATGRFSYILGSGPSRRVWFVHRSARGAAAASVRVRVRAPVSLRGSRRRLRTGQTLVLNGRAGARAPRGLLVELQARRGRRWQTFGTTNTRRGGRFRYSYRFTRTLGVQVYRLRARVPRQRGYPFAPGGSRPVRVRVRG